MAYNYPYNLDKGITKKISMMVERCTRIKQKKDAVLLVEGGEGEGKTNTSVAVAGKVKEMTGREIHLFFKLKPLIDFAKSTEEKIIIWDEPSLDSLSTDQLNKLNKDLIRLLMNIRKKRHFFIFNLTKFYKFHEYIVVDRGLGMIHMYSRKNIESGRFVYIRKDRMEYLYNDYKFKHERNYKKYSHGSPRGSFPEVLERYFDLFDITINGKPHCNYTDYNTEKDKGIFSIGEEEIKSKKELKAEQDLRLLKFKVSNLKKEGWSRKELSESLGIPIRTMEYWSTAPLLRTTTGQYTSNWESEDEKNDDLPQKDASNA